VTKHKVLIVGGGFGGVKAALELSKHDGFEITLLSENIDFRYYPTFYHTATGGLKAQSSIPLKEILDSEKVRFVLGTAAKLDREKQVIHTGDSRKFPYDTLIMALGTVSNFFGIEGLKEYSYSIKSLEEIARFKKHVHQQLTDDRKPELNYVIVGAGPTGIELAGALPAYLRTVRKAHQLPRRKLHIDLIEAAPRLLPRSGKATSRAVRRRLRKLGVKLFLNQAVQAENADSLMVNGKPILSHTVIWTAGVATNPFYKANGFTMDQRGKVAVDQFLQAEPRIYILGDNAGTQYSGLAQTALTDAHQVTRNLVRIANGKQPEMYKPKKPITVIPVAQGWAAVEYGKIQFSGRLGWLLRSAADWIGFKDLEPWWKASEQWLTEFGTQEDCPTCSVANMHKPDSLVED
jgi:NADH:ubiquinone reductase (H+-translocating)